MPLLNDNRCRQNIEEHLCPFRHRDLHSATPLENIMFFFYAPIKANIELFEVGHPDKPSKRRHADVHQRTASRDCPQSALD